MSWLSWLTSLIATAFNQWLANKRSEQAMRDLGAATQAAESLREAEREEAIARAASEVAAAALDDPRDLRD